MMYTKRTGNTIRTMDTGQDLERTRRRKEGIKGGRMEGRKAGQDRHQKERKE